MTWLITGNGGTTTSHFLGTTDARPLVIRTGNTERMRVATGGDISIGVPGTRSPDYTLDVGGILNADELYEGGSPLVGSQWTDVAGGITYGAGNVGIGALSASHRFNVDGVINATGFHEGGTPLVGSQWEEVTGGITYTGGSVGMGKTPGASYTLDVDGVINATDVHKNGAPLSTSQWANVSGGINYAGGNVGIGATGLSRKLQVQGSEIHSGGGGAGYSFGNRETATFVENPSGGERWVWYASGGTARLWSGGDKLSVGIDAAAPQITNVIVGPGANGRLKIRHIDGKHWLNDNDDTLYLNWGTGKPVMLGFGNNTQAALHVSGDIRAGNSDIYFTRTDHNHTGIGNTAGFAAIENAANYGALMILGRAGTSVGRNVRLWDYLQVNGGMDVTGNVEFLSASNPIRVSSGWTAFPDPVTNKAEISNDIGTYKTLMIVGNRSAGLGRRVSVWDRLEVNGTLVVTGNAFKPGGGWWSASSDIRLKRSVESLKDALGKLVQLRGVSFEWKKPEEQGNLTGVQMGLVAQEVEEVFPEWISTDPSGYKNLTVRGFEALVVEAFKQLKAENETLKTKLNAGNEELRSALEELRTRIEALEPA